MIHSYTTYIIFYFCLFSCSPFIPACLRNVILQICGKGNQLRKSCILTSKLLFRDRGSRAIVKGKWSSVLTHTNFEKSASLKNNNQSITRCWLIFAVRRQLLLTSWKYGIRIATSIRYYRPFITICFVHPPFNLQNRTFDFRLERNVENFKAFTLLSIEMSFWDLTSISSVKCFPNTRFGFTFKFWASVTFFRSGESIILSIGVDWKPKTQQIIHHHIKHYFLFAGYVTYGNSFLHVCRRVGWYQLTILLIS